MTAVKKHFKSQKAPLIFLAVLDFCLNKGIYGIFKGVRKIPNAFKFWSE